MWRSRGVVPRMLQLVYLGRQRDRPLRARRGRPARDRAQGRRDLGGDRAGQGDRRVPAQPGQAVRLVRVQGALPGLGRRAAADAGATVALGPARAGDPPALAPDPSPVPQELSPTRICAARPRSSSPDAPGTGTAERTPRGRAAPPAPAPGRPHRSRGRRPDQAPRRPRPMRPAARWPAARSQQPRAPRRRSAGCSPGCRRSPRTLPHCAPRSCSSRRPEGCSTPQDDLFGPERRPGQADHRPRAEPGQPQQPARHGRDDLRRPVPRPRHHLRRDLPAGGGHRPGQLAQHPHAPARPRLRLRLGPIAQSELYDPADPVKLRLESGGQFEDLPRRADGSAVVGDPRNDSNLIISGLHAAFLAFHNRAVDATRAGRRGPARRRSTGPASSPPGTGSGWWSTGCCPTSSADAVVTPGPAPRSAVVRRGGTAATSRSSSPARPTGSVTAWCGRPTAPTWPATAAAPFFGLIFDSRVQVPDGQNPTTDPGDLRGGFRAARRFVGWQTFFDFGGAHSADVRPNKVIDTKLSTPLFALPTSRHRARARAPGPDGAARSAPCCATSPGRCPSGQAIARQLGVPPLHARGPGRPRGVRPPARPLDPALALRAARGGPRQRRPVPRPGRRPDRRRGRARAAAGRPDVVPPTRSRAGRPRWGRRGSDYDFADFLRFAGVDPDSRGQ